MNGWLFAGMLWKSEICDIVVQKLSNMMALMSFKYVSLIYITLTVHLAVCGAVISRSNHWIYFILTYICFNMAQKNCWFLLSGYVSLHWYWMWVKPVRRSCVRIVCNAHFTCHNRSIFPIKNRIISLAVLIIFQSFVRYFGIQMRCATIWGSGKMINWFEQIYIFN